MNFAVPLPAVLAAAALAAVAQIWFWRRTSLRGRRRWAALVFRLAAIALLAWILTGPEHPILTQKEIRQPLVLVDISRSMDFPGDGGTRAQQARAAVENLQQAAPHGGNTMVYTFGSRLITTPDFATDPTVRDASLPAAALRTALTSAPAGRPPHSILLISDGAAQDASDLTGLARTFRDRGVPVSILCTGASVAVKNAAVIGLDAPRRAEAGSVVPVTVTARRQGIEESLVLELLNADHKVIDRATLSRKLPEDSDTFNVTIGLDGFEGSIRLSAIEGETTLADNEAPLRIATDTVNLRVLYMEGSTGNNGVMPEPVMLSRALEEHGDIEVDLLCLNVENNSGGSVLVSWPWKQGPRFRPDPTKSYPPTREELNRYDVIICSDIPSVAFTSEQIAWTVDLVAERGAGFVMIGGHTSFGAGNWDRTPWEKLVPLDMDNFSRGFMSRSFPVFWSDAGKRHPLLAQLPLQPGETIDQILEAHPLFYGTNYIRRAKPAATVLMRMEDESGVPLIAVQPFGKGRTMAFTSDVTYAWGAAHNTMWGPPDGEADGGQRATDNQQFESSPSFNNSYYRRFWQRAVRWLGENSVRVKASAFEVTTPYLQWPAGQPLPIHAAGPDNGLMSRLSGQPCVAQVRGQPSTRVKLAYDKAAQRFSGMMPRTEGLPEEVIIDVEARDPLTRSAVTASLEIRAPGTDPESSAPSARPDILAALAETTGGDVLQSANDAAAWLRKASREATSPSAAGRRPSWDRLWALVTVLALLSADWLLRRLSS
ncbi:MAG: glutamine amidotransferase [Verrucomicrobiales bacterium]